MFTLFFVIVLIVLAIFMIALIPEGTEEPDSAFWTALGLLITFALGSVIPSIAVAVRRFHDQDRSGWMYLLNFVPYVGGWIILVFMCLDGTKGPNRFGPDPLNPAADAEVFS